MKAPLRVAIHEVGPCPDSTGIEGHGEGLKFGGQIYFYRVGKWVPKDKVVSLVHEGNWCGRQRGDREWIIVAWDCPDFVVLAHVHSGVSEALARFKGLSVAEAVKLVEDEMVVRQKEIEKTPKCSKCGRRIIRLEAEQLADECFSCMSLRLKKGAVQP